MPRCALRRRASRHRLRIGDDWRSISIVGSISRRLRCSMIMDSQLCCLEVIAPVAEHRDDLDQVPVLLF
jgi:hypothetical protein